MNLVYGDSNFRTKGESVVAQQLKSYDSKKLTLAFNLNFLPGVRDIDILVAHKDIGVFFLEVKSYGVTDIIEVGYSKLITKAYDTDEAPWVQAYSQYEGFRDFTAANFGKHGVPNFTSTALFNNISRSQWIHYFGENTLAGSLAEKLFFREDLISSSSFERRLRIVAHNPPVRKGREAKSVSHEFLKFIDSLYASAQRQKPSITERKKLKDIEDSITSKLTAAYPPGGEGYSIFEGMPGTGKTFRLLAIGYHHAFHGIDVLFVCFNKTLGADIDDFAVLTRS
jgi:hypothetical protein